MSRPSVAAALDRRGHARRALLLLPSSESPMRSACGGCIGNTKVNKCQQQLPATSWGHATRYCTWIGGRVKAQVAGRWCQQLCAGLSPCHLANRPKTARSTAGGSDSRSGCPPACRGDAAPTRQLRRCRNGDCLWCSSGSQLPALAWAAEEQRRPGRSRARRYSAVPPHQGVPPSPQSPV